MRPRPVVLMLFAASAVAAPPREAVSANERGIAHLASGRAEAAVQAFRETRRHLPHDRTVARNLAAALASHAERRLQARRAEEAIELLREAQELHPARVRYRMLLGRAYLATGRPADQLNARDWLVKALEADRDYLPALLLLAGIDYRERRLEEGTERLERAAILRPNDLTVAARLEEMRNEFDIEKRYVGLNRPAFVFRYDREGIPKERVDAVVDSCERAWADLTNRFRHYPEGRIFVTLYSPDDFRRATRLHGWVAGVSDGSIRLTVRRRTRDEALERTIRHELAHHVIRDFAPRTPVWLHEGLAQMAEGLDGSRAADQLRGAVPPTDADLDRSILRERDPARVSEFYALSLAFTHYLTQLQGYRGIQGVLEYLKQGRSLDDACRIQFGKTRAELFEAWQRTIRPR